MKKYWLILLFSLLFCIISTGQTKEEICLSESIISKIIDELLIKDHLLYKVNLQDSIITAYQEKDSINTVIIQTYKLKEEQYNIVVKSLNEELKIVKAQNKDLKREKTKQKIKATLIQIGEAVVIVVLSLIIIQTN